MIGVAAQGLNQAGDKASRRRLPIVGGQRIGQREGRGRWSRIATWGKHLGGVAERIMHTFGELPGGQKFRAAHRPKVPCTSSSRSVLAHNHWRGGGNLVRAVDAQKLFNQINRPVRLLPRALGTLTPQGAPTACRP